MSQDLTHTPNRETSLLLYHFEVCHIVVVTLSFNAKMVLVNFECNLNGPEKVTCSLWEHIGSGHEKQ